MTSPHHRPDVLVTFAVREEAKYFKPAATWPVQVRVCCTGIGKQNALKAIRSHLDAGPQRLLLTCGFAGGLNPDFARNTILFSSDDQLHLASRLRELGGVPARFHCAEHIAITRSEKRQLREATGADAVEMESEVIRQLCRERGIPSATVRVISDAANDDLPLDFNVFMTASYELSYLKLAGAVIRSPGTIAGLLELRKRATGAASALARCLESILGQATILGDIQREV